jgi:GT2 family glycosyltransferase
MAESTTQISIVIPSWNAKDDLKACLDSLLMQSIPARIIVVENGSMDGSLEYLQSHYPQIDLVIHHENKGFAGGVNAGIRLSMERGDEYVALFNNDAVADPDWLKNMVGVLSVEKEYGIATCKFMAIDRTHLDSTGDIYTNWGLTFPRGRGEPVSDIYDSVTTVFAASGGASLYRTAMLKEIGLFDEDFFAYYEDVDISFRAQLAAWQVRYVPGAIAYHQIGATSGKMKGFTTYQTMKNLPLLLYKNVPSRYLWRIGWRLTVARTFFLIRAISRGLGWYAIKGDLKATQLLFKKIGERRQIQKTKRVSDEYIWAMIGHDLPPNAHALRKLRRLYWKLTLRKQV